MKALVIAGSGQVGRNLLAALRERGHEVTGTYRSRPEPGLLALDITDRTAVESLVRRERPAAVFLPAAFTDVDASEARPDEAMRANADGPENVGRACAAAGARFVHFSTDYVFDGAAGPYGEDDEPRPLSHYARSKLEGERRALALGALVIRTANVFSYRPGDRNFFMQVYEALRAGRPVHAFADQFGTPSYAPMVAAAAAELAERGASGIVHVAGTDFVSRVEWCRRIAVDFGLRADLVIATTTKDRPQKAARPARAGLRTDKARSLLVRTRLVGLADAHAEIRRAMG